MIWSSSLNSPFSARSASQDDQEDLDDSLSEESDNNSLRGGVLWSETQGLNGLNSRCHRDPQVPKHFFVALADVLATFWFGIWLKARLLFHYQSCGLKFYMCNFNRPDYQSCAVHVCIILKRSPISVDFLPLLRVGSCEWWAVISVARQILSFDVITLNRLK